MSSVICNSLGNNILSDYIFDPDWEQPTGSPGAIETIIERNESRAKVKLALHTADPTVSGSRSHEVNGEGYSRQVVAWSNPGSKTIGNAEAISFQDLPICTVTHLAVWTNEVSDVCLMTLQLPTPLVVGLSDAINIPANNLVFSL